MEVMQTNIKLVVTLILVGFFILFIVQNSTVVEIRFLFWKLSMSRALLLFFVLAAGMIAGWLVKGYFDHKKS